MSPSAVIIDDDDATARALARLMTGLGYAILGTAGDADSGAALIRRTQPNVALVDVKLGGARSGLEIAVDLAGDAVGNTVPLVFITAFDEPPLAHLAGLDGVYGFVNKPVGRAALRGTIELVRMQAESRSRVVELQRHYQALFDQAAVGVAQRSARTGQLVDVNRKCAAIFACAVSDLVGTDLVECAEPEHRAELRAALESLGSGAIREHAVELACRRRDDALIWVKLTVAALDGAGSDHVVIVEDTTERHQAVSANRESEARARSAVAASRAKTEFLAHMSHELRTPLNAVLGLSEALLERVFGPLAESQAAALSTIHSSGRHLLELINDVLDIARVEAGSLPIETEQVLVRPLLEECAALFERQIAAKGQRLVVEVAPALPPVDVDRRRIKQVLLNLLGNAAKFSPPRATVTLSAAADEHARRIAIAVTDDGPGIAPSDLDRIFEPFVTLDPSLSRSQGGAGLGLPLAKRIVDLHRGTLRLDSELGRGSTFTVEIPISASYVADAVGEPHPAASSRLVAQAGAGQTVLLAEDNDATVLSVRAYLENHGYHVRVVRDGVAALGAAGDPDVAVVLMDIQIPGIDGLEVTRRLRAREAATQAAPGPPIVALTAHAMPGDEQRCLAAGASAYMAKPVRLAALVDTIGRLLENRR